MAIDIAALSLPKPSVARRRPRLASPDAVRRLSHPSAPPAHLNPFHSQSFVLESSTRNDPCVQQLALLDAKVVLELHPTVYALVVEEKKPSFGPAERSNFRAGTSLVRSSTHRMIAAAAAAAASAASGSTLSSPANHSSEQTTTISPPGGQTQRDRALRLGIRVWTRAHLLEQMDRIFTLIRSKRSDLDGTFPCTRPRIIIEDIAGRYKPSIRVFEPITPLQPSLSSYGRCREPIFATKPAHTYPIVDVDLPGSGSPFIMGKLPVAEHSPLVRLGLSGPRAAQQQQIILSRARENAFCEICSVRFSCSESDHFRTAEHQRRYRDPDLWRWEKFDEMIQEDEENQRYWETLNRLIPPPRNAEEFHQQLLALRRGDFAAQLEAAAAASVQSPISSPSTGEPFRGAC